MDEMRGRNQGTWDRTTNSWRIKGQKIYMSPKKLAEVLRCDVPSGKEASRPFWNRYLALRQNIELKKKEADCPLQKRLASIHDAIAFMREQQRDTTELEKALSECLAVPAHDINHADVRIIHPDVQPVADSLFLSESDEYPLAVLESVLVKPVAPKDSLKVAVENYINFHKQKSHNGWQDIKRSLDILVVACGDISFREITTNHYEEFLAILRKEFPNKGTRIRRKQAAHTFLKGLETKWNINYGFIRCSQFREKMPEGKKEQYTIDEIKKALSLATGTIRTSLLLAINCGFYWSDICSLTPSKIKNGHIVTSRKKCEGDTDGTPMVGEWLLWQETEECIKYGLNKRKLEEDWTNFYRQNGLRVHKAIRKGIAQWIQDQDELGDTHSRLYRCENVGGTHGRNYIKMNREQVAKLDKALIMLHKELFS